MLRLYEEGGIIANGQASSAHLARALEPLRNHPLVGDIRSRGLLACIELVTDKASKTRPEPELGLPDILSRCGYERRVLFRAFGDAMIGLAPPLVSTIAEIDELVARVTATLDDVLSVPAVREAFRARA